MGQAGVFVSIHVYFGWRLRHWRLSANLTQSELARHLGYDQSHISKVEGGERWPPPDLPARADQLFNTGGELTDLWPMVERERHLALRLVPQQRRGSGDPAVATDTDGMPRWPGPHATNALRQLLQAHRSAGETVGGGFMVSAVEHYARTVAQWQSTAPAGTAGALLGLAAEFAELAGQARFDSADYAVALYWYTCAGQWATLAGDSELASRLLGRRHQLDHKVSDHPTVRHR